MYYDEGYNKKLKVNYYSWKEMRPKLGNGRNRNGD